MSTHTDPTVKETHDLYQKALDNLVFTLHRAADEVSSSNRLCAFDDDGHMRHFDHASGIVASLLRYIPEFGMTRLIDAGEQADEAIRQARSQALL